MNTVAEYFMERSRILFAHMDDIDALASFRLDAENLRAKIAEKTAATKGRLSALREADDPGQDDPWSQDQIDGIGRVIRDHCGPATAKRVIAIISAMA